MAYSSCYLPVDVFKNMKKTFTKSNLKYKLIPNLIRMELLERARIGYNALYGSNSLQKGKALYDVLILTKKGIKYIENLEVESLNSKKELIEIRNFYKKQLAGGRDKIIEERFKKIVLTDYMFDPWFFINPILGTYRFKDETIKDIYEDLLTPDNFRYFRSIECKRRNGNLFELRKIKNIYDYTKSYGLAMSSSKFFGIIESSYKTVPVYMTSYGQNVKMFSKNEESLINKIVSYTGRQCNDAIYVYHCNDSIKKLIEREDIEEDWKNISHIIDIHDFQRIYLLPYGRSSIEFEHIKLQMSIEAKDMRPYWKATNCFEYHNYIFAEPFVKEALRNSQDLFISVTDEYNYIIGYLPELRHLRKVFRYYKENPNAKPLTIICDERQVDFYKKIFETIMKQDKLYFSCSKFIKSERGLYE